MSKSVEHLRRSFCCVEPLRNRNDINLNVILGFSYRKQVKFSILHRKRIVE